MQIYTFEMICVLNNELILSRLFFDREKVDGGATETRNTFWRPPKAEAAVAAVATVMQQHQKQQQEQQPEQQQQQQQPHVRMF